MNKTDLIEQPFLRNDIPDFRPGDSVKVHVRVVEGNRERVQVFQGVVIRRSGGGIRETFTVRKISFGVGVERTFPLHSPSIARLELLQRGLVRRAKLYYLPMEAASVAGVETADAELLDVEVVDIETGDAIGTDAVNGTDAEEGSDVADDAGTGAKDADQDATLDGGAEERAEG